MDMQDLRSLFDEVKRRKVVHTAAVVFGGPNWTPDGSTIVFGRRARMRRETENVSKARPPADRKAIPGPGSFLTVVHAMSAGNPMHAVTGRPVAWRALRAVRVEGRPWQSTEETMSHTHAGKGSGVPLPATGRGGA